MAKLEPLIIRLEASARRNPTAYRWRVMLVWALGYGYFAAVLLGLGTLLGGLLWLAVSRAGASVVVLKLGWPLLVLAGIVIRALWVRVPQPTGISLDPESAPRLFAVIDEVTAGVRASRPHVVLVTDEFNASVIQIPRLGFLGWPRNYLLIGLPLLSGLTPDEFRAVLAHEVGHLSGHHGRFSAWVYRARQTWQVLLDRMEEEPHRGRFVFERFLTWYAPFFNAYSFVLAREQEYEADTAAAKLCGAETTARALICTTVGGHVFDEVFWRDVYEGAKDAPEPTATPFSRTLHERTVTIADRRSVAWLREALSLATGYHNTHPALSDRLAAVGYAPDSRFIRSAPEWLAARAAAMETAAEVFLGVAAKDIAAQLDVEWAAAITPAWRERHAAVQEKRGRLATLVARATGPELPSADAWEHASLVLELEGDAAGLPLVRSLVVRHPHHAEANYALGHLLVARDDHEGVAHLERAMAADPDAILGACAQLYAFFARRDELETAARYRDRAERHQELLDRARAERRAVGRGDALAPHGLDPDGLAAVVSQLRDHPRVRTAYLVRKVVSYLPEQPLHVIGVVRRRSWIEWGTARNDQRMLQDLVTRVSVPGDLLVIVLDRSAFALKRRMRRVDGALVLAARSDAHRAHVGVDR